MARLSTLPVLLTTCQLGRFLLTCVGASSLRGGRAGRTAKLLDHAKMPRSLHIDSSTVRALSTGTDLQLLDSDMSKYAYAPTRGLSASGPVSLPSYTSAATNACLLSDAQVAPATPKRRRVCSIGRLVNTIQQTSRGGHSNANMLTNGPAEGGTASTPRPKRRQRGAASAASGPAEGSIDQTAEVTSIKKSRGRAVTAAMAAGGGPGVQPVRKRGHPVSGSTSPNNLTGPAANSPMGDADNAPLSTPRKRRRQGPDSAATVVTLDAATSSPAGKRRVKVAVTAGDGTGAAAGTGENGQSPITPVKVKVIRAVPPSPQPPNHILTRAALIQQVLEKLYPDPDVPLNYTDNFTLLCGVLLSAQTTDGKVNEVTQELFRQAPNPQAMAKMDHATVLGIIRTVGLAPTKAKHLIELSRQLCERFGGEVPRTYEDLQSLPGVGRKTASVVMNQAFGEVAFPVDTHVHRLALRWGLSKDEKNAGRVEQDLCACFPDRDGWGKVSLQMIYMGREFCQAKKHEKQECPVCSWVDTDPPPQGLEEIPAVAACLSTPGKAGKTIVLYGDRKRELDQFKANLLPELSSDFDIHRKPNSSPGKLFGAARVIGSTGVRLQSSVVVEVVKTEPVIRSATEF